MGLFSYVYYSSIIREHHVSVGSVLQTVVTHLSVEDQLELYRELTRFLVGQGVKVWEGAQSKKGRNKKKEREKETEAKGDPYTYLFAGSQLNAICDSNSEMMGC